MSYKRIVKCNIAGDEYELLFSMAAEVVLKEKYGGIEGMYDKIQNMSDSGDSFGIAELYIDLFVLMANQTIKLFNFENQNEKKKLVDREKLLLLFTEADVVECGQRCIEAIQKAKQTFVESGAEQTSKN